MTDAVATPPAGTPPAGTPPAGTPPAAPPPAGHGIAWLPADADAELVGHVQNKGWQSPADAAKAHREAERLIGADRAGRTLVIPSDENDQPGWQKVHERLGRPANAADYKLPVPDGQDGTFATAVAAKFHQLGIPLKAGQALAAWYNEQGAALTASQQATEAAAVAAEEAQLSKDWGSERKAREEIARRGAIAMGFKAEHIDALQKVAGFSAVMKAMAKIGDTLSEHGADHIRPGSFGMTPEGAKARRSQLMADREWGAKARNPKSAEWAELQALDRVIAEAAPQN